MAKEQKLDLNEELKKMKKHLEQLIQSNSSTNSKQQTNSEKTPFCSNDKLEATEEQLNFYEKQLLQQLDYVRIQQQKVNEKKINCFVCKKKEKNVVLNGCNHLIVCVECEKLSNKLCPLCFTEYNEICIINL